jgi:leucyl aminopeptidase
MEILAKKGAMEALETDLLAVTMFEDQELPGQIQELDESLGGLIGDTMKEEGFEAKMLKTFLIRLPGASVKRLLLIGLGKESEFELDIARQAAATAVRQIKALKIKRASMAMFGVVSEDVSVADLGQAMAEGMELVQYMFDLYKKSEKKDVLKSITFVSEDGREVRQMKKGIDIGVATAKGVMFARDLVNTPGQDMYPKTLMERAKDIAKGVGSIRVRVYDKERLEKMGAGGLLGVAQGSIHEPYLVHMIYKPEKPVKKKLALVGKAVTFDSGGLSLKPSQYMETMKCDMGGSAAVLGAFASLADLKPNVEVHGIFGAAENMPSGEAIRPGDVLTAMNKKTIEVLNTDAEGRLTLADTLSYAVKQKPDAIIDLATLTGACVVALGEEITAVMGNNEALSEKVLAASKVTGEKMWPMPLEKNYKKLLKSDIADMKNIGGRYGGALTAGLFLQEFVQDVPWVHLDIAGPAFAERPMNAYTPKGASGHPVRTLLQLIRTF